MTQDMRVALITSLQDRLVAPLKRSLDEVEKEFKDLERTLGGVGKSAEQAQQKMERMRGPKDAARDAAALAKETERAIGLAGRLQTAWSVAGNTVRGVSALVGAVAAARIVVEPALAQARTYQYQLADAANTAFSDRDTQGREKGMRSLDDAVIAAVRAGGGTRESALQALQKLLANGIDFESAQSTLKTITRAATASGASGLDLAEIVTKLLKNNFKPEQIEKMIGKGIAAGQAGSFEMKNMAQWLPKLLAAGTMSGMGGMRDYEKLLAYAQVSATTAGSADEAGNNLLNFLLKINSPDTANDARKQGIDLAGTLAAARAQGMSAPDAFMSLLNREADRDPRMVALRKKYAAAGSDTEKQETLKAQEQIFMGTSIGKYLSDRQALMSALAVLNNPALLQKVYEQVQAGGSHTTAGNFDLMSRTSAFKVQQAENEKLFAQTAALEGLISKQGQLAESTAMLYRQHPLLAQAMEAAKVAAYALAAAAGAASGVLMLLGGKGLLAARGAAAAGAGAAAAGATAGGLAPAVAAAARAGLLLPGMGLAGAGTAAAGVASLPILGAGMLMSEQLNSVKGLQARISTRNERLRELTELAALDPKGAPRYEAEIDQLKANLAELEGRLGAQAGAGRGFVNPPVAVNVYLDGQQIQSAVNRRNTMDARRN